MRGKGSGDSLLTIPPPFALVRTVEAFPPEEGCEVHQAENGAGCAFNVRSLGSFFFSCCLAYLGLLPPSRPEAWDEEKALQLGSSEARVEV